MYKEYASKQFVEEYFKNQQDVNKSDWAENDEESPAHILNRPGGYVETDNKTVVTSTGVVLENYSLFFEDGYGEDLESFGIIPGMFEEEQYLVIWDDKKYICSPFEAGVAVHIGHNEQAEEGEPGFDYMPFLIASKYGSSDIRAFSSFQTEETGITSHTFSLYKIEETPIRFDKKYLPENVVYFTEGSNGTEVPDDDEGTSMVDIMQQSVYDPQGYATDIFAYIDEHSANIPITSEVPEDANIWIDPSDDESGSVSGEGAAAIEALKAQMPLMITLTNRVFEGLEECSGLCDSTHTYAEIRQAFDEGRMIHIHHICLYPTINNNPRIENITNIWTYPDEEDDILYFESYMDTAYMRINPDTGEDEFMCITGNG